MFGKFLFVSQLLAMLMCAFPLTLRWPLPLTLIFIMSAMGLFMWVLAYNRLGNWSVLPQPKESSRLVERGPYRWMRHPMYSAILLGGVGFIFHNQTFQSVMGLLLLWVILLLKAKYEERLLMQRFPNYEAYIRRVNNRFIPKLPFRKLN